MSKFKVGDIVEFNNKVKYYAWYREDVFYQAHNTFVVSEVDLKEVGVKLANDPSEDWISDYHLELVQEQSSQETKQEETKHVHYDLILKWASNPDKYDVYCREEYCDWDIVLSPSWNPYMEYKLEEKQPEILSVFSQTLQKIFQVKISKDGTISLL